MDTYTIKNGRAKGPRRPAPVMTLIKASFQQRKMMPDPSGLLYLVYEHVAILNAYTLARF